ncbi:MAG: hypothetical protein HC834_00040 [Rhodospirillales bacterium]|nr:hypothetical protein [Rhodospirillales bacterium]
MVMLFQTIRAVLESRFTRWLQRCKNDGGQTKIEEPPYLEWDDSEISPNRRFENEPNRSQKSTAKRKNFILARLQGRPDSEHEQALIRIFIVGFFKPIPTLSCFFERAHQP